VSDCLEDEALASRQVIIASNRGPITFQLDENGKLSYQRGSGGLVTALTGLARQVTATWISCVMTEEDKRWPGGKIPFADGKTAVDVRFIAPDEEAYEGYYNVIANPLLWFLQHSMWDVPRMPVIDRQTWKAWSDGYMTVNREFAEEIIRQLKQIDGSVLVMLQDYHLYLVAGYLRDQLKRKRPSILHFVHIPWPGPEYWGILPPSMRQAILIGLCAVDILGLQTREDALNFIRTCESYLPGANVNYRRGRVWYRNHATHVRDFPISIDVQTLQRFAYSQQVEDYEKEIRDIVAERKLILRIDRSEPSKNIVRGFQAFGEMMDMHPEWIGKVTLLALLMPSRLTVEGYQEYLDELMAAAGWVNANYGGPAWEPVRILVGENYARAVAALKQYNVLLVNSIADGMNLVAKEGPVVNQRDGVLILSERTGAQQQLGSGAIVISPCDIFATGEALHQALSMPSEERHVLAERLRWLIEREDINDWLCRQLDTVDEFNL
jgi:trehalose 6-phosphate synthase